MRRARLAIMVGSRGRGSNMGNLIEACRDGRIPAQVSVVVGSSANAPALEAAEAAGVITEIVPTGDDYGLRLLRTLLHHRSSHLALAGYLALLPVEVVHAFPRRLLNVHPALLPKFGGKGMFGLNVHAAVLAAGEAESGATVHYVTERYDEGEAIVQRRCPVLATDTAETLAARVLIEEHAAYIEAWQKVLAG